MGDNFYVTPECATDLAQMVHNHTEENGEINHDEIINTLTEQLSEELGDWLEEHIDWDKILDDDRETKEFIKEKEQAEKGEF